jgi:hypothetical protein
MNPSPISRTNDELLDPRLRPVQATQEEPQGTVPDKPPVSKHSFRATE